MKVDYEKKEVVLTEEDIKEAVCPLNVNWAVSMIQLYGPGERKGVLGKVGKCPDVLKKALEPHGWKVIVEGEETKAVET